MTLVAAGLVLAATGCVGGSPVSDAPDVKPTVDSTRAAAESTEGRVGPSHPGVSQPTETDIGRRLRVGDDGATIRLNVGETAILIQDDPGSPDPVVKGDALELVEMLNIDATDDRQWEIRAVKAGSATIEAVDGEAVFTITVRVQNAP